jgi:hypothetical protein
VLECIDEGKEDYIQHVCASNFCICIFRLENKESKSN